MARPGVTYNDVLNAATQLTGQGKNPTIEAIRAILRTGSIGTINNHLRKWKAAQAHTQDIGSHEKLPEELISLMKGLWKRVILNAKDKLDPVEESHQRQIIELQQSLEKYKTSNRYWQKIHDHTQQQKIQLLKDKSALEQELKLAQHKIVALYAKQDDLLQQLRETHGVTAT